MPARDQIHIQVRTALEKDGWTITADPLFIPTEGLSGLYVDLAAQKVLEAEKDGKKIVIEIKGFGEQSMTHDFYEAVGQFLTYEFALQALGVDWPLFLAVPLIEYGRLEKVPLFLAILRKFAVKILIIDTQTQQVVSWQI